MAKIVSVKAPKSAAKAKEAEISGLRDAAGVAAIFCALLIAYWPALNGTLLWDDNRHVTPLTMQSLYGLWRTWFELGATQQYYPLLHSAFWLEHRFWGDTVLGYHLTNLVLHTLAAYLVVMIVRRLSLPGAWLAGCIFALHPVCVESVAWISEQKTTLSAVFYLGSALVYFGFDRTRIRSRYLLAIFLFVLALLSKTVTATLPAALLLIIWWYQGKLSWKKDVFPLLPWFAIGAGAGLFTAWVENTFIGAEGPDFTLTALDRCLIAGRAICFYLGHLLWPTGWVFIYPRWTVSTSVWWQYLFPIGVLALTAALIVIARRHRGPLTGFLFFAGTLFPVLGFFNVYPFVYSYVADHFVYLASLGIIVPAAVGLTLAARRAPPWILPAMACALLLVFVDLSWSRSSVYVNADTLYRATLAGNPDCWLAQNNLGADLLDTPGGLPEAIELLEASVRLKPIYPQAHNNLGMALSRVPGRLPEAIDQFKMAVHIQPNYLQARNNLGIALSKVPGRLQEAISEYQAALRVDPDYAEAHDNLGTAYAGTPGRLVDAISEYEIALRINPNYAEAHYNLGNALSNFPDRSNDAVSEYQAALRANPNYPEAHNNLGLAMSSLPGRLPDAINEFQAAIRLNPGFVEAHYNLATALSKTPAGATQAIAEYEAALRLRPDLAPAQRMLDRLRAAQR